MFLHRAGGSKTWGVYVTSILVAVLIPFIQSLFARLAVLLTDNENHFGQSAYDSHLAFKVFLLNTANYFGALLYICFVKQHTYGCANDCCMDDASLFRFVRKKTAHARRRDERSEEFSARAPFFFVDGGSIN